MAPPKKPAAQAEIALLPGLKNCLVNLPANLVAVLTNANTVCTEQLISGPSCY
jgi:peroxin-1